MFTMTKEKALEIQNNHLDYYCQRLASPQAVKLRQTIKDRTTAEALPSGVQIPVIEINRHIPRGGDIEDLYYDLRKEQSQ